jgi:hypothetical protein
MLRDPEQSRFSLVEMPAGEGLLMAKTGQVGKNTHSHCFCRSLENCPNACLKFRDWKILEVGEVIERGGWQNIPFLMQQKTRKAR